ncbi:hypothetical protein COU57_03520 [Candidatus Pacearchaeota archaeon CG10_big_fil_rev_8_21_14_0_10_32_14]|nr:MAG: hypothetical protein COU57_03520 [Candidatus Pacearchaeota archaeon CG10_big_fil_rev_8_21_14_0_10_32_14]
MAGRKSSVVLGKIMKNKKSKTGTVVTPETKGVGMSLQHGGSRVLTASFVVGSRLVSREIIILPGQKINTGIECTPHSDPIETETQNFAVVHGEVGHFGTDGSSSFKNRSGK